MTEDGEYTYKTNFLTGIKPDQTVIVKKRFIRHLPGVKPKEAEEKNVLHMSESSMSGVVEEWYPSVNSYYHFTEDVDAFARVHHLLETKRSSDSIDKEQFRKHENQYSEKTAQRQYLNTRPMCFLVLGKPGLGEEEVGKRLAEYWKCVYIDPLTLLEEEIERDTRPGQCIEFNLRCGRSVGIDILTRLLAKKVQSPECLHRGFVCCGFPLIPNDLYEEDPISSESAVFNVQDIFDEIIEQTVRIVDVSAKVAVSMVDSSKIGSETVEDEEKGTEIDDSDFAGGSSAIKMSMDWSLENQICGPADISTDLEKQLNVIFGLFRDPFMIIYLFARNSDVVSKRDNYYFDVYSKKILDMQKIKIFYDVGSANEELVEDLFDEGKNPFADNPSLKHIVKLPENLPANVNTQLDRYHNDVANSLDCRILQHSHPYYLKLDVRSFISQMMKQIKLHIKILGLQPVIIPRKFVDNTYEQIGEGPPSNEIEEMTVEEAFRKFSRQDVVTPMFKWAWSDWGTLCPVSMSNDVYQNGSPKYAVHCFNKIYFLADEYNYHRFIENPRPYLLPPFPKPGSNIFVFGPPVSGKSAVAQCLGYLLNSKVLTPNAMHQEYFTEVVEECKEQVRQVAMAEAMEILKERLEEELKVKNEVRQNAIAEWEARSVDLLSKFRIILEQNAEDPLDVMSSFPMKMGQEGDEDMNSMDEGALIRQKLLALNFPRKLDLDLCNELIQSRENLYKYLPSNLKDEIRQEAPSVLDPFVLQYADSKVEAIELDKIREEVKDNMYEMYTRGIRATQDQPHHDGWIIDGMTTDTNLLQQVCEEFSISDIIILTSSDLNFLVERFKAGNKHITEFRGFRELFLKIGENNAAWRAPSVLSTDSYKKQYAADILSDVIKPCFDEETLDSELEADTEIYKEALNVYVQELKEVEALLEELQQRPLFVDVRDLAIEDLLQEVVNALQDRYRRRATEFTDDDRAEEIQQFLSQADQGGGGGGEGEGGDQIDDNFFAKNRQYGDTFYYCPVTFSNRFVLWRGKEQFGAKFKDKLYLMANEANMKEFIRFPRKYLLQNSAPELFPPPRICVIGPDAELKTQVAQKLAKNIGVRYLNFVEIKRHAIESLSTTSIFLDNVQEQELPDAILLGFYDMLLGRIWFREPYKYVGFVIDGFPKKTRCLNYMIFLEAIPDLILCITLSREEALKRQLEKFVKEWRESMEKTRKEEEIINSILLHEWEEKRKARYNELIEAKRQSRYSKKLKEEDGDITPIIEEEPDEMGFRSDTQISFDSVVEQQEHDETMRILDEEFPEPVFEESQEFEEVATEKFAAEIENRYDEYAQYYEEMRGICDAELIPYVEIDGSQDLEKVIRHAYILGNDLKFRGQSLFERCYDVPLDVAEKLLTCGYYLLSFFGRLCPVQNYEGYNPLHMYIGDEQRDKIFPVIHRQYIYFLSGKKHREKFFKNPLKYTTQREVLCPLIPLRVAVIGPPKSGKTSLANRFRRDLGFQMVSQGEAIRYTLANPLFSNLINEMEKLLRQGKELTDELMMASVQAAFYCGQGLTQGLIFDGFPNSITGMNFLAKLGLVPHLIFDLQISKDALLKQAANPNEKYPLYSQRFISHLLKEWENSQKLFRVWCDREYQNIYKLPVDRSIWGVWDHAKEVTLSVSFERKHYYRHVKLDWPLRLAYMLVTPIEFLERQSAYKTYCPGCLFYSRKLTNGGDPPDRTGLIHYGKHFYWLCEEHIEEFLKNPEMFLPPCNVCLPQELPVVLHLTEPPENPVEDGYCLVCYQRNFPKKLLHKGDFHNVVFYRGKYYMFDEVACLNFFMATPDKLFHCTINFKEDNYPASLDYRDLPVMGMLEQYVARKLVRAVNHVNVNRPVIPGLSISQAALICVGLNLKVHNYGSPDREQYEQGLQIFHERRSDLLKYLQMMKRYMNPFVQYAEPDTPSSTDEEVEEEETFLSRHYSSLI